MKKIASLLSIALLAGTLASCNEDFKDWADPQSNGPESPVEVAFTATGANAYDFNTLEGTTEVKVFTPQVACNVEGATTTYSAVLFNEDKTKSTPLAVTNEGMATIDDITSAVIKVAGTQSVARELPMTITAITKVNGQAIRNQVENVMLKVTIVPVPVPEVWYISGNFVGNATTSPSADACVAMLPNPDNYEEIVFGAKLNPASMFRIYKQEGSRYPYIARSKEDGSIITVLDKNGVAGAENIMPELAEGYYKIVFNVKNNTITYEPITEEVNVFTSMAMPGSWQKPDGWKPGLDLMNAETTATGVENHDWSATVTFESDCEFKFCANGDWVGFDWGNAGFPLGVASAGSNIQGTAGTYKVFFNDITKNFYFLTVE